MGPPVNQFCCIAKSIYSSLMRQLGTGMLGQRAPGTRQNKNKQSGRVTKCTSEKGHVQEVECWLSENLEAELSKAMCFML